MLYRDSDPIVEMLEAGRCADIVTFETTADLRQELLVASVLFVECFRKGATLGLKYAQISESPIGVVEGLLQQLELENSGPLRLTLSGEDLDMANALYIRTIQISREVLPEKVLFQEFLLDEFNLSYHKSGGMPSPVYIDHLRERQDAQ